ncbi:hypothetical protein [Amantichitinum ursilacus]|uniref:Uncharacterized protein n=1 Tax=Amantichitinum ursilacus TaxID=857265 RepID=A0A0N1JSM5_9NEIS|nr:hypothetical protein [Amantichitinum ursilacus]KPC52996.1 hypothetical protein WG78_10915 [Amantichitinum ursilacus]
MSKTKSSADLATSDWRHKTLQARSARPATPTETPEQRARRLARWNNEDRAIERMQREIYQ